MSDSVEESPSQHLSEKWGEDRAAAGSRLGHVRGSMANALTIDV